MFHYKVLDCCARLRALGAEMGMPRHDGQSLTNAFCAAAPTLLPGPRGLRRTGGPLQRRGVALRFAYPQDYPVAASGAASGLFMRVCWRNQASRMVLRDSRGSPELVQRDGAPAGPDAPGGAEGAAGGAGGVARNVPANARAAR